MAKAKGTEAQADEDKLVAGVFDKSKHDKIAEAVKNLSSEEAEFFLFKLESAIRKRNPPRRTTACRRRRRPCLPL